MSIDVPYLVDVIGRRFPIIDSGITLGRSESSDVYIPDRRVSRRHAEIEWDGEYSTLHDVGSANGTFLNGQRLTTPQTLRNGDEIAIAGAVFTFYDPEATLRVEDFPLLVVDKESGDVWVNRNLVRLSPKERALFDLLYQNAGQVCSKAEIAVAVWPEYHSRPKNYQIESLIKRLREKLEPSPRNPQLIITLRGQGYRLVVD